MPTQQTARADRALRGPRAVFVGLIALSLLVALFPPSLADAADDPVEITLVATNDFHGRLQPPSGDYGGAAYLATHLDAVRADNANTLFVDAGDLVGATPVLSNLFYDEPTIELMNLIGLDVQTVGNHEFDRGQDELLRRRDGGCLDDDCAYRGGEPFEGSDFVTLSTNVIVDETGEALTQDYEIVEVDGVSIGFIGVTTVDTPLRVTPTGVAGLSFQPEAEAVNATVPDVVAAGADVIVVLMHEGARQSGEDINACEDLVGAAAEVIAEFDDAVDVVVTGHTHQSYVCDFEDGPLVTQAWEYGKMFTEISLTVDRANGELVSRGAVNREVTRDVDPDPAVEELIERYEELAGPALAEVVGTSEVFIPRTTRVAESAQGNLATDALLDQYDVDFAFQNSGGLRADLTVEDDLDGELYNIRRTNVLEVWPFGNTVSLAEVDGELLAEILDHGVSQVGGGGFMQVGGLRVDYGIVDTSGDFPQGQVVNVEYWGHATEADGTPVDLSSDATYTIALNNFMAVGGDGYPDLEGAGLVFSQQDALEVAVERYLEANSPVVPQVEGRIVGFADLPLDSVHFESVIALATDGVIGGFDDGTFGPSLPITRGQVASIMARAAGLEPGSAPYTYSDIEGNVHAGAIQALSDAGIISGLGDGTFGPGMNVRRDQMASLLGRWLEVEEVAEGTFTDIDGNVHAGFINALAELDVIRGTSDTTFGPALNLRRDQGASLLARSLAELAG